MREGFDQPLDLGNKAIKARIHAFIDSADGWWEVKFKPRRLTRRARANALYWAAWVTPLAHYLREQDASYTSFEDAKNDAHAELVKANLGVVTRVSPITGEVRETPKPTHTLSIEEFSDYLERCAVWLAQMGIIVQDCVIDVRVERGGRRA